MEMSVVACFICAERSFGGQKFSSLVLGKLLPGNIGADEISCCVRCAEEISNVESILDQIEALAEEAFFKLQLIRLKITKTVKKDGKNSFGKLRSDIISELKNISIESVLSKVIEMTSAKKMTCNEPTPSSSTISEKIIQNVKVQAQTSKNSKDERKTTTNKKATNVPSTSDSESDEICILEEIDIKPAAVQSIIEPSRVNPFASAPAVDLPDELVLVEKIEIERNLDRPIDANLDPAPTTNSFADHIAAPDEIGIGQVQTQNQEEVEELDKSGGGFDNCDDDMEEESLQNVDNRYLLYSPDLPSNPPPPTSTRKRLASTDVTKMALRPKKKSKPGPRSKQVESVGTPSRAPQGRAKRSATARTERTDSTQETFWPDRNSIESESDSDKDAPAPPQRRKIGKSNRRHKTSLRRVKIVASSSEEDDQEVGTQSVQFKGAYHVERYPNQLIRRYYKKLSEREKENLRDKAVALFYPMWQNYVDMNEQLLKMYKQKNKSLACAVCAHLGLPIDGFADDPFHMYFDIQKFKAHYTRYHISPIPCRTCGEKFDNAKALKGHHESKVNDPAHKEDKKSRDEQKRKEKEKNKRVKLAKTCHQQVLKPLREIEEEIINEQEKESEEE